ncbi:MAG: phosphoglucosamine mutase [Clostridia bacterium]|nr:phosphoglucosamine mutase [Clostridia bacterium]
MTAEEKVKLKNKYFGTDGFRGEVNIDLNSEQAFRVGRFLGWYYSSSLSGAGESGYRARIVIGKDTRRSSYTLEYAIAAGLTASGADAYMLHVTTTPSVSYVTQNEGFDCGIMITASHNPYYDNGIKIINRFGEKLDDRTTALIEAYIDGELGRLGLDGDIPLAKKDKIGRIVDHVAGRNRYVAYLISLASHSYKHLRIGLDSANGASWSIASALFGALGAKIYHIGNDPDGTNINRSCGSTSIERLCELVRREHLDVGFAFDGDADRCIAVDEKGRVVDGDGILYVLAKRLRARGMLENDTVVATVMSNSGFFRSLENIGIDCVQTTVGDRFVYERMQNDELSLGGEQSGHIIIKKYATTGDGLLSAIMLCEEICDTKRPLSALCEGLTLYPQYVKNIRVRDQNDAIEDARVRETYERVREEIGDRGRLLLRKSGTEPLLRIMVECESIEDCHRYAEQVAESIREGGHELE